MNESVEESNYQKNREVLLNRAKDYYKTDKERLREQARDRYRNLSKEEKICILVVKSLNLHLTF